MHDEAQIWVGLDPLDELGIGELVAGVERELVKDLEGGSGV